MNIPANISKSFFESNIEELLKDLPKKNVFLGTTIIQKNKVLSENVLYFLPVKDLELPDPKIIMSDLKIDEGYRIKLNSNKLAKNVFLNIEKITGFFSDNYFDLLPGEEVAVDFFCKEELDDFNNNLKIKTVWDTYYSR